MADVKTNKDGIMESGVNIKLDLIFGIVTNHYAIAKSERVLGELSRMREITKDEDKIKEIDEKAKQIIQEMNNFDEAIKSIITIYQYKFGNEVNETMDKLIKEMNQKAQEMKKGEKDG